MCGDIKRTYQTTALEGRPVSAWANTILILSLAAIAYYFFAARKLPLMIAVAAFSTLLAGRIVVGWLSGRGAHRHSN
jgi:hypothetical protein